jgi:hypothetical protein
MEWILPQINLLYKELERQQKKLKLNYHQQIKLKSTWHIFLLIKKDPNICN